MVSPATYLAARRWLTAVRIILILDWRVTADRWRWLVAPIEFPESVYDVLRCTVCRLDVHRPNEMCEKQKSADCSACGGRVLLDYWGCSAARKKSEVQTTHRLSNVAPATPAEWKRLRFTIVRNLR